MAAPERFAQMSDFPLAPRAPSIQGTRLASRPLRLMSALRQQSGLDMLGLSISGPDLCVFARPTPTADVSRAAEEAKIPQCGMLFATTFAVLCFGRAQEGT